MITVKTYLYPNIAEVQVFDPAIFTKRNRIVYSRPIKVYQGVDNPIQVTVRNQDQKNVNLTGYTMQASVQDPTNQVTIETYAVSFANAAIGNGNFTIDKSTINTLENRFYKLTFKTVKTSDSTEQPIYIDDNYGVPLDLEVLPAYWTETVSADSEVVIDGGTL
jgi:hypothetical protein